MGLSGSMMTSTLVMGWEGDGQESTELVVLDLAVSWPAGVACAPDPGNVSSAHLAVWSRTQD